MNTVIYLLALILSIFTLYAVIPDLLLHWLGVGTHKRQNKYGVALTFDDGPNPAVTPRILDVLETHHVQATFFLVGERARKYPDLVREIIARGHSIGAHGQYHRFAWFMFPWTTWLQWEKGVATLKNITGMEVQLIRPPWGTFNLVTWCWIIIKKKRAVLWDVDGRDWQARRSPSQITARVMRGVRAGSIVLLHDAGGGPGAPENTLRALCDICRGITGNKNLPLVQLDFVNDYN
ncbi:polysaccharide deacetylase family protein, partial [Desulfotruncus alcoholivorax]|uniref:polysaccharide deacetylase family protein n=1 Tax=Desulfotruncus alcoholivorax TaxID=265477 RepID=UPI00042446DA